MGDTPKRPRVFLVVFLSVKILAICIEKTSVFGVKRAARNSPFLRITRETKNRVVHDRSHAIPSPPQDSEIVPPTYATRLPSCTRTVRSDNVDVVVHAHNCNSCQHIRENHFGRHCRNREQVGKHERKADSLGG
jgi:hypothetical protein